jgi:hypothetical protein
VLRRWGYWPIVASLGLACFGAIWKSSALVIV